MGWFRRKRSTQAEEPPVGTHTSQPTSVFTKSEVEDGASIKSTPFDLLNDANAWKSHTHRELVYSNDRIDPTSEIRETTTPAAAHAILAREGGMAGEMKLLCRLATEGCEEVRSKAESWLISRHELITTTSTWQYFENEILPVFESDEAVNPAREIFFQKLRDQRTRHVEYKLTEHERRRELASLTPRLSERKKRRMPLLRQPDDFLDGFLAGMEQTRQVVAIGKATPQHNAAPFDHPSNSLAKQGGPLSLYAQIAVAKYAQEVNNLVLAEREYREVTNSSDTVAASLAMLYLGALQDNQSKIAEARRSCGLASKVEHPWIAEQARARLKALDDEFPPEFKSLLP